MDGAAWSQGCHGGGRGGGNLDSPDERGCLLQTLGRTQQQQRGGPNPKLPPPRHYGGAFMDDTYLWGE